MKTDISKIAGERAEEFKRRKRPMTVKSILKKFGYERRSETATSQITKALRAHGVFMRPPIEKIGNKFQVELDDKVSIIVGKVMNPGVIKHTHIVTKRKDAKAEVKTISPQDSNGILNGLRQGTQRIIRTTRRVPLESNNVVAKKKQSTSKAKKVAKKQKPVARKSAPAKKKLVKPKAKRKATPRKVTKKATVTSRKKKPARTTKIVKRPKTITNRKPKTKTSNLNWIDKLLKTEIRNEREVETRFIIPILIKLGYTDRDRYEEMMVEIQVGSKKTKVKADFVLFAKNNRKLRDQELLIVEAKSVTKKSLTDAVKQMDSYASALYCHFGMATNSKEIRVEQFFNNKKPKTILKFAAKDLKKNFSKLEKLISKEALIKFYSKL